MAGLDPEPLLDWSKPYKLEHIEWAIERRGRRHLIDIFPFGEGPVDTNKLKRVCLVEAPKDHWGVWLVQEKNTSLALSAPPSLGDEKDSIISAQSKVIGRTASHVFKVPDCANFKIDCGPAAVCNAIWLSSTRRRGHPGGIAYISLRKSDHEAWCNMSMKKAQN